MLRYLVALVALAIGSAQASTYYLSPAGLDSNPGTSAASPWLTPNHYVNCGDVIVAATSTAYVNTNLQQWGVSACPASNNVAWLKCATFDGCVVTVTNSSGNSAGIMVNKSFWGVQGFEVDDTATSGNGLSCYGTSPNGSHVHHVIFANNVASTCPLAAFGGGSNGLYGTDYLVIVGNIAYNGGVQNFNCGSNINVFSPVATDSLPGTHIYIAGNFSFHSRNPYTTPYGCYDSEGIILDTFDGNTTSGLPPYTQQAVIEQNLVLDNGSNGILIEYNSQYDYSGTVPSGVGLGKVYVRNNTMWGNSQGGGNLSGSYECGELRLFKIASVQATANLAVSTTANCYGGSTTNNPGLVEMTDTSTVAGNWLYSSFGNSAIRTSSPQPWGAGTFVDNGVNTENTNPAFAAPAAPAAPSCSTYISTVACLSTVITNFTPTTTAAKTYGYQVPSTKPKPNALFPAWLCHVNLPPGLITSGCIVQPVPSAIII